MLIRSTGANRSFLMSKGAVVGAAAGLLALAGSAQANLVPFSTRESSRYLLIGMGPENTTGGRPGVGQAVNVNNFELGANKAPVPSTSDFLLGGGGGGPGLRGNVPDIPLHARPVHTGICYDGNVAVTHRRGVFNLQDVGVYGDLGVRTAKANGDVGTQNSFYNDPNHFPNTFTSTGFDNPGVNHNIGGFGFPVNPNDAVQSTRMDAPNAAGITGNVDFSGLTDELADARSIINGLSSTSVLDVSGSGGTINSHRTITLNAGLNIIDIVTGGGDFKVENSNFVVDGPADSMAIFRLPDHANFIISQANILIGVGGLELGSVVFYTDRQTNNQHYNFNNTVINGVAFWTLGEAGGEININNAQGCTQLIADKITLNDVRFCRCEVIPAPGAAVPILLAGAVAASRRRR